MRGEIWNGYEDISIPENRFDFFTNPLNWPLFYHTAKNMKLRHILGVAERNLRQTLIPYVPVDFDARYKRRIPEIRDPSLSPIERNLKKIRDTYSDEDIRRFRDSAQSASEGKFTYLNKELNFGDVSNVDWHCNQIYSYPQLWRIRFHSFDFLRDITLGYAKIESCPPGLIDRVDELILDWISNAEIGQSGYLRREWIPHTVSLRIINWSRYIAWRDIHHSHSNADSHLLSEIYKNALFLENHIENDVGGNHLIENAAALIIAGVLFGNRGGRWRQTGTSILKKSSGQFLDDGGHFERSPMYHILCLTRYLTVIDVLRESNRDVPTDILRTATNATTFLRTLRPPDGKIPLLNDSTFDEALPLDICLSYAGKMGISSSNNSGSLHESGYFWLGSGDDRLLVDGGEVGPPHLPAHSHNDIFSIIVWISGERLVTDTGTYEYAPTVRRQYSRGIASHNSVQVDAQNPIDIGGRYVMGRRVNPTSLRKTKNGIELFEGRYAKKGRASKAYVHHRAIFHDEGWWLVWDRVSANHNSHVTSRLHFHPDVSLSRDSQTDDIDVHHGPSGASCLVSPVNVDDVKETVSPYFPRFGEEHFRPSLKLQTVGHRAAFGFLLSNDDSPEIEVEFEDSTPTKLHSKDGCRQLPALEFTI